MNEGGEERKSHPGCNLLFGGTALYPSFIPSYLYLLFPLIFLLVVGLMAKNDQAFFDSYLCHSLLCMKLPTFPLDSRRSLSALSHYRPILNLEVALKFFLYFSKMVTVKC